MENKLRLLYLQKILLARSDEEHPLTTQQLVDILESEYGIPTHRTTIAKNIEALQEFGLDVIVSHSSKSKYYVGSRSFQLPELKLLIDAVESSKFITKKKSQELIEKIYTLTSPGLIPKLKRDNYIVDLIKPTNEKIYYIVDTINDAITQNKQIMFQYYDFTANKEKILKNDGELYILSPYHLLWKDDYYYVLGYSRKREGITTFRVDRIATQPLIIEDESVPKPDDFDLNKYVREVFLMYGGESYRVELLCENGLMKTMIDRFGEDIDTIPYNDNQFKLSVDVSVSQTFYGWIFGFGGRVKILSPKKVRDDYKMMIVSAVNELMNE